METVLRRLALSLPYYNLLVGLGVAVGIVLLDKRLERTFADTPRIRTQALLLLIPALLVGFAAARLLSLALYHLPFTLKSLASGGLVFYGAYVGVACYCIAALSLGLPLARILSDAAAPVSFAHGIGRIGCAVAGCCYGRIVSILGIELRFPTQIVESVFLLSLGCFLWRTPRKRFLIYLLSYSSFRFLIEFLRGDDRGAVLNLRLSPAQLISLVILLAASGVATKPLLKRLVAIRRNRNESSIAGM